MKEHRSELVEALDDYIDLLERQLQWEQTRRESWQRTPEMKQVHQSHINNARERIRLARPKSPFSLFKSSVLAA
jgi:ribosome-associated translation inhibitor RaiA